MSAVPAAAFDELAGQARPRRAAWRPHEGPQTEFLSCGAFEVGFGGSAGPGKSEALLIGALRHVDRADYRAILFRRTYPELEKSLIERSFRFYPSLGAVFNRQSKTWTFPSGAKVIFGHLQYEQSTLEHLSAEYQYVAFDECVTFEEKQLTFLMSRLRSSTGIPTRMRWASNPADDDGHWLLKRYAPWLDTRESYTGPRARPGQTLWFVVDDNGDERAVPRGADGALSRAYFPALLKDNPTLMRNDPGYADRIRRMGPTEAARYLGGDWFAREVKGALFSQADFDLHRVGPSQVPELMNIVVGVDPAVSNKPTSDEHGIVVAGVSENGHVYVLGDWSKKGSPNEWGTAVVRCFNDTQANQVIGEGNNGGDLVESNIANIDGRVPVKIVHASRGKDKRAGPIATLLKRGRVHIVGTLPELESECRRWVPGVSKWSPNRMDAFVWAATHLVPAVFEDAPPPEKQNEEDALEQRLLELDAAQDDDGMPVGNEWVPE